MQTTLRAIHKDVIFQFEDQITKRTVSGISQTLFKEVTPWGFEFSATKDSMETARWVRVIAVGPEVSPQDVVPGMRVLVEPLKWTNVFVIDGDNFWKTNLDHVLVIDES